MARPKKPNADDVLERGESIFTANQQRDRLWDRMDDLYDQKAAIGSNNEAVKVVTMPHATNIVDLVMDLASQVKLTIQVPANSENQSDKKAADAIEKWLSALFTINQRAANDNFPSSLAFLGTQRGATAMKILFSDKLLQKEDKDASERYSLASNRPVILQVRDPRVLYPVWGWDGPVCVYERYNRKAADIRLFHPGTLTDKKKYSDDTDVEWVEYWDEKYYSYWADGDPVPGKKMVPHGYGCVPYAFGVARTTPRKEPSLRYRPLLLGIENDLLNLNIWYSILATAGWAAVTSGYNVFSEAFGKDGKVLERGPEAVNYFQQGDRVDPMQRAPLPGDFFQLGNRFEAAMQQGTFPLAVFGESPGNMAGYAINLLTQSGRRSMLPVWSAVETCIANAFVLAVQICRNKVADLVGEKIPLTVVVDVQSSDLSNYKAKRELVLDTSKIGGDFEVFVKMADPMPKDKAENLRMALEATQSARPLMSIETALREYGITEDASTELIRVAIEAVTRDLQRFEALKIAIERGLVPENIQLPEGYTLGPDNAIIPKSLLPQPEPAPPQMPQMPMQMPPDPAAMQQLAGQAPPISLEEMAGGTPSPSFPVPGGAL